MFERKFDRNVEVDYFELYLNLVQDQMYMLFRVVDQSFPIDHRDELYENSKDCLKSII